FAELLFSCAVGWSAGGAGQLSQGHVSGVGRAAGRGVAGGPGRGADGRGAAWGAGGAGGADADGVCSAQRACAGGVNAVGSAISARVNAARPIEGGVDDGCVLKPVLNRTVPSDVVVFA